MDKFTAKELIIKILRRDYNRWIQYTDETGIERKNYKQSFCVWKDENNYTEQDAELIAELFAT